MFEEWYLKELISDKIKNIWKLSDYYLLKLLKDILEKTGIFLLLEKPVSIESIILQKKYPQKVFSSIQWILDRLKLDGYISSNESDGILLYQKTDKSIDYNESEILSRINSEAPDAIAAFKMLKLMADNYPDYLSGKKTGVDILFSPENITVTNEYYTNNIFYNVHNIGGAKILNWDIEKRDNPTIIEIGGGLGGGTKQFVLQRLAEKKSLEGFTYFFTDIANKMLRSTRRDLRKICDNISSFQFKKLNFNDELEQQGFEKDSVDVIWGVNAAHVAYDLRSSLTDFLKILKPGGSLIISETVRAEGNSMIQQEFLLNTLDDYWNVKLDPQIRPHHGFMKWNTWVNALQAAGFSEVQTIPDMKSCEAQYDNCYVAMIRGIKK